MNRVKLLLLVLCLIAFQTSASDLKHAKITGIYSNLYYNEKGGDLLGMEILIFPSKNNTTGYYSAFVQIAEGGFPITAIVELKVIGNKVEFVFPESELNPPLSFAGELNSKGLTLKWENGNEEKLSNRKSYWQ